MSNTITPTAFYRTLNVEGLEISYLEGGLLDLTNSPVGNLRNVLRISAKTNSSRFSMFFLKENSKVMED